MGRGVRESELLNTFEFESSRFVKLVTCLDM